MKKLILMIAAVAVSAACNAQTGEKYKDFSLPGQDGKEITLSDVVKENKYTLLDFWATWCGPCMREVPYLKSAYDEYKDKGFEIFGVSYDEDSIAWQSTIKKSGLDWVQVSALKGWNCPTQEMYGVRSIPRNLLIDSNGTIVAENLRGEALAEKLAELLK